MKSSPALPNPVNVAFVEKLYEDFLRDPSSVSPEWKEYLTGLADGELRFRQTYFGPSFRPSSIFNPPGKTEGQGSGVEGKTAPALDPRPSTLDPRSASAALQDRIYLLIRL